MDPDDLLKAAKHLATTGAGKPKQAYLKRAVSTTYYAMFHCLAKTCADLLIGGTGSQRSMPAWTQVYRALDHGITRNVCSSPIMPSFPSQIQDFANTFVSMQKKRHDADYDPQCSVSKSAVLTDIGAVDIVIAEFATAAVKDRRAFATAVLLKRR